METMLVWSSFISNYQHKFFINETSVLIYGYRNLCCAKTLTHLKLGTLNNVWLGELYSESRLYVQDLGERQESEIAHGNSGTISAWTFHPYALSRFSADVLPFRIFTRLHS